MSRSLLLVESLLPRASGNARPTVRSILPICLAVVCIAVIGYFTSRFGGGRKLVMPPAKLAKDPETMAPLAGHINSTSFLGVVCKDKAAPAGSSTTCGSRVSWLQQHEGIDSQKANIDVAVQFPIQCGCLVGPALQACLKTPAPAGTSDTCGARMEWLKGQLGMGNGEAATEVARQFPDECGCMTALKEPGACLSTAAPAGGSTTCGSRVTWLQDKDHLSLDDAQIKVSLEYPAECSCLISSLPRCKSYAPKLGVGLNLKQQVNPLSLDFAVRKLASTGVRSARLWDYDSKYLEALDRAGIKEVLVNVPTYQLPDFAAPMSANHPSHGLTNILKTYHDRGMAFRVGVGNEPFLTPDLFQDNKKYLAIALRNVISSLSSGGLDDITVTVCFATTMMETSYPPQAGTFRPEMRPVMQDIAELIYQNQGEFSIQPYPYHARRQDPANVPLDLALGENIESIDGRHYNGLLGMMVAASRAALVNLDQKYATIPLSVTETGWPTAGGADASAENQCKFTRNTAATVTRASLPLDPCFRTVFFFEVFDEGLKEGDAFEQHFGLFTEDGEKKCNGLQF